MPVAADFLLFSPAPDVFAKKDICRRGDPLRVSSRNGSVPMAGGSNIVYSAVFILLLFILLLFILLRSQRSSKRALPLIRLRMMSLSLLIGARICFMLSRSRIVTVLSSSVSKSTVTE